MTPPLKAGETPAPIHHPSAETLAAFTAGNLRAGFDLVVAAHLRTCPACRLESARLEQVGGHLLSELDPVALHESALAETLARLDEPAPAPLPPRRDLDNLLQNARRRWVAPGVWTAQVDTPRDREDRVYLLQVAPGATTARHSHSGAEFTQVLSGRLIDDGVVYGPGDFAEMDENHTHRPQVLGDEPCTCLFATQGRLVPTDLLGRIAFTLANV